jgi:pyruvate formate lyase activating enzyme
MHEALLWQPSGERVACLLCPHACKIAEDRVGVCGVRRNVGGTLMALTYGRVSSVAVDPIEKKPVFHYFPGTSALSLGSVGCTMKCGHCQNWQISRAGPEADGLHDLAPQAVVDMAVRYGCLGVAFTYNEPVIWLEYVMDVATLCRRRGLYTVMVTNGYVTSAGLDMFGEKIDVWRVDIKGTGDEAYRRLCKVPSGQPVREAAERAKRQWHMHVECVTNVVPTVNDSEEELRGIARWMVSALGPDTPWHVTRFFPYLEFSDLPSTPLETLHRAVEIGREEGLQFIYLGNVDQPGGEDTICPDCGEVAVHRSGYAVASRRTREGACARCGRDLNLVE